MRRLKKYLPNPESLKNKKSLNWLGPMIHAPDLWHFNRHSVAGGVAVGAFFAFIIPVGQFIGAAIAALFFRVNLPTALVSTLISNPFTYAPLYYLAYVIGSTLLGGVPEASPPVPASPTIGFEWSALLDSLTSLGAPLMTGMGVLAIASAIIGYGTVHALWRLPAWLRLRRRRQSLRRPAS